MTRRSDAGVTLIEVLIAVTLVSVLCVAILFAMRVGLNALSKGNTRLMDNRRVAGANRILERQIEGFLPVIAQFKTEENGLPLKAVFFDGEPQSMRFVSTYSLQEASRGLPRILEFQVAPGENGARLVVNEWIYTGPRSAGFFCAGIRPDPETGAQVALFRPIEIGPRSFVLADRLAFCRFSYLDRRPPPELARWYPAWGFPRYPQAVRVEMAPVDPDTSKLRPVTITAPVRVNRYPVFEYGDL